MSKIKGLDMAASFVGDARGLFAGPQSLVPSVSVPRSIRLGLDEVWGERLYWDLTQVDPIDGNQYWAESEQMLDRFLRIKDADDVLRFARRYGVLKICDHGFPYRHPPRFGERGPREETCELPRDIETGEVFEPVEGWLHLVRSARLLLRTASAVRVNDPQEPFPWDEVRAILPRLSSALSIWSEGSRGERQSIGEAVEEGGGDFDDLVGRW